MRAPFACCVPFLVLSAAAAGQQGEPLTLETVLERGPALVAPVARVLWHPEGHGGAMILDGARGNQRLFRLTADGLEKEWIVSARALHKALGIESQGTDKPARFPQCSWRDPDTLRVEHGNALFLWTIGAERAEKILEWPAPGGPALLVGASFHSVAPGDAHVGYIRQHQLWLRNGDGGTEQLTKDGSPDIVYGGAAHRAEFGITTGLFWSPNGRYLAFSREDMRPIAAYPYQDIAASPPEARQGRYPMAGSTHSKVTIGVCDTMNGRITWLEHDPTADIYWTNVAVQNDGTVFVARVNRGQDHAELTQYDGATGKRLAVLVSEHDPQWIEPEHAPTFLPDGRFLWWSRRDGYRHLWLHAPDGKLIRQITKGAFDVQALLGTDDDEVWFQAAGDDPRQLHLFAAKLDGSANRQMTKYRGTHNASLSADRQRAWISSSTLDAAPSQHMVDLETGKVAFSASAPSPLESFAMPRQEFFTVQADDGSKLYGHVAIPPDLKEGERRPVLLYVYGGPHAQLVTDSYLGGAPLWLQALAAEGYVVCRLDNRGTPNRGIEFEQSIWLRLGTKEVDDQLRGIEWLGRQPYVDSDKIAVHGWSYGGYMTLRLLLLAPDTFACGISGAPVTDWGMYETGYTERYMNTPAENAEGYLAASCLPLADRLQRPLLLVHGTDDRTVMWSHTLRFVDRCIAAGKELTYFPYPMQKHGLRGRHRAHFLRMMRTFLHRHLGEPSK